MQSYLTDGYQKFEVNPSYSTWRSIKYAVPQSLVFGRILFNIFSWLIQHMITRYFLIPSLNENNLSIK